MIPAFMLGVWSAILFAAACFTAARVFGQFVGQLRSVPVVHSELRKTACLVEVHDRYHDRSPIAHIEQYQGVSGVLRFDPKRLRRRPMPTTGTDQYVLPLEKRYPELARRLQETAYRLAQERGEITTDDIWEAYPIPVGVEPRIMAAAFKPRDRWRKTGRYVPTKRPEANRRPVAVWELREAA